MISYYLLYHIFDFKLYYLLYPYHKDGFLKSEQEVKENTVIDKGSKLTLEFKDQMPDKGNKYVMQIGDTYHLMNDAAAPHRASDFETITERNGGGIGSSRNMKYDINMKAGRTLSAGEKIRLWIVNDNGHKYESQSWRLYINTGKAETDKDIVNVEGENFERDYNPYYFQHSKSVDGVMVTKYSYVPQVEEIFDTDTEIKGTVRRDQNDVTGYYMAPDGSKYYFSAVKSDDTDKARTIILDENGREVKEGDKNYENVFNYVLGTFKSEDGKENLKLKKDMPIYLNNSRKGQFPSDPVIEKVKARVTFDQNYEGKPEDKVVVAPENEQALGTAGYTANGLDYNGKNVMPKDPTREGYTFVGWAKTPDATKADFTKDTPIENSLTVYAVWKKTEITDNLTPAYTDADGKVGTQTTITSPNFTDKDGKDAAKPEGTKFALGKGAPEGATINPDTGEIKYTPTKDDAGKDVEIPVVVTYPDDSTDNVVAKVTVAPAQKDADKYEPEVKKEEIEKGGKVDLTDNVTNLDKLPEGTKVEDVTPEGTIDTNKPGDYTGKIKVTYPDGSSEEKDVPVTVKDTTPAEKDADKITPNIPAEKTGVKDLENLTDEEKKEVKGKIEKANKDNFPAKTKVDVDNKGNATITYPDGSKDVIPAKDLVFQYKHGDPAIEEKPELKIADIIEPNVPGKTEVGDKNNLTDKEKQEIKDKIEKANKDNFPEGTKVDVDNKGNATITYPDGSKDVITADKLVNEKSSDNGSGTGDINIPFIPESNADESDNNKKPEEDDNKKVKTDAEKNPAITPEKTGVKDKNHLTDEEKQEVIDKVKKANPAVIDVIVDDKGNATLIYADGSKNFINADDLIYQVEAKKEMRSNTKGKKAGANVKTGVGSVSGLIGLAGISIAGLLASKKKEEEDK